MADAARRTKRVSRVLPLTVVGVDADHEPLSQAAAAYRGTYVYPHFAAQGFAVTRLLGPLARRVYVAPEAAKPEVEYVTGVGHGEADLFYGDQNDIVFQTGTYQPAEVSGKIVHLLSCRSARALGPDMVSNGARAFFGYDQNFSFVPGPYQDVYFECDAEIDRAFADGLTAADVYARARQRFDDRIADLRAAGKTYEAGVLEYDRNRLRCPSAGGSRWGDPAAKLG